MNEITTKAPAHCDIIWKWALIIIKVFVVE